MPTVEQFEDLDVWKRSRALANLIYDFTEADPFKHDFVLRDQIRRAVVSVMSNIAEGFESKTQGMFIEYLALDRKYISQEQFNRTQSEAESCSRQIASLSHYLESKPNARRVREEGITYNVEH